MAPLTLSFVTIDVFTTTKYAGNPLAIILVPAHVRAQLTQTSKQAIAREFNLSESVFLHLKGDHSTDSETTYDLDIFTTDRELPFAGHPTIGSATYLLKHIAPSASALITKAGPIPINLTDTGAVLADIPHDVHMHKNTLRDIFRVADTNKVEAALSDDAEIRAAELDASVVSIVKGMTFLLVQLPNLEALGRANGRKSAPLRELKLLDEGGWDVGFVGRYYYVEVSSPTPTSTSSGEGLEWNLRTRMIEGNMVVEDPATGSAACTLASWLSLREGRGGRFGITQGVEMGRRSEILVETRVGGDGEMRIEGVRLGGSAVVVMKGSIEV